MATNNYGGGEVVDLKDSKHDDRLVDSSVQQLGVENGTHKNESGVVYDAVFGEIKEGGPSYRSLTWIPATVLLIKTQIGLGVLAIPSVLHTLGIVPGVIVILVVAVLTTWSDYVVGTFKVNHPEVYTLMDVGQILFGPVGREVFGLVSWLTLTGIAGANLLSASIALNAVSLHGTCTLVFVIVATIVTILIASWQTLHKISWFTWFGLTCLLTAILTLAISVGINDRPSAAPQQGPFDLDIRAFGNPTFVEAMSAVANVGFSYAGTPAFFNVVSEMRNPRDFTKSVLVCQLIVTTVYLVIGGVVYHFCGQYVASPALGSAGPLMKRVCYGIAIPGLIAGAVINTHFPAKYVFVRILKGKKALVDNSPTHWIVWLGCVIGNCTVSFLIAEGIPFFGNLLGLIGALLGTIASMQAMGAMHIYDSWRKPRTFQWKFLFGFDIILITIGTFIMVAGTYASVVAINDQLNSGDTAKAFGCADNSGSV